MSNIRRFFSIGVLMLGPFLVKLEAATTLTGDHLIEAGMESGNLELEGTLSVGGSSIDFGTTSAPSQAVQFTYHDGTSPPSLTLDVFQSSAAYYWRQYVSSSMVTKMSLSGSNVLEIFAPTYSSGTPNNGAIRLTPALSGSGGSAITVDGQRALTLADSSLFVTQSSGSVTGSLSVAGNITSRGGVVQSGTSAYSGGIAWGLAIGPNALASQHGSIAIGTGTKAYGPHSVALGVNNEAQNHASTATGGYTKALSESSFAGGFYTVAHSHSQFVIGVANQISPSSPTNTPILSNPVFIVGNGSLVNSTLLPNASRSNAFVVRYNGNAEVQANISIGKSATVQENLTVNGDIEADKASFTGRVRVEPQGGISMGEFTHDPEAEPEL